MSTSKSKWKQAKQKRKMHRLRDNRSVSVNRLIIRTIPKDVYHKRKYDLLLAFFYHIGVKLFIEATLISGWTPKRIKRVNRVFEGEIIRREEISEGVVSFVFKNAYGGIFPAWNPGAHIDVFLPSGKKRQYSLTGISPQRDQYQIAVRWIPDGGGGSIEMHSDIKVGDIIRFEGPRTAFRFVTRSGRVLFIAGGIGITPLLPMVTEAKAMGLDWKLVYAGRSRASMPFCEQAIELDLQRVTIWANDERGGVSTAQDLLVDADDNTAVYLCGPVAMLDSVIAMRSKLPGALFYERFSPPPVVDEKPFELVLATSGKILHIPGDRSALDVLVDSHVPITYSCRQGFCGTCKVKVLKGQIKHRINSSFETDNEILLCMSRGAGDRLVIDM